MPAEKLSTHEIRMARNADRERHAREGTTPFTGHVHPKPTQTALDAAARLNAARALPDAAFADDPEVQSLSAAVRVKSTLIEKRIQVRDWLLGQQARLEATIEAAEGAVPQAILEDAVGQDEAFTKTREALAELEFAKSVRAYADVAYDAVAQSNPATQYALYNGLDATRVALNEHLFALKLAHVDAQARAGHEPEGEQ